MTILCGLAIIVAKPSVMSFMPNDTASTHFLSIVNRLYSNRDRILSASKRLIELSHQINSCSEAELREVLTLVEKEIIEIVSIAYELRPHLKNRDLPHMLSEQAKVISTDIRHITDFPERNTLSKVKVDVLLRTGFCLDANRTEIKPTSKSIKEAFGIKLDLKPMDIEALAKGSKEIL